MYAFFDNLRLSFGTFRANVLRTLLTLLGIVMGVATVVSMMALIDGLQRKVNHDLSQLGANTFQATKWPAGFGRFDWRMYARRPSLTSVDAQALRDHCPSVSVISESDDERGQKLATENLETRPGIRVFGSTPNFLETAGLAVATGRFFNETEHLDGQNVVVVGVDVSEVLFPGMNPLGHRLRIRGRPFRVIGVLQQRGSFLGMESLDNQVIVPLRAFQQLYGKARSLNLNIQAKEGVRLEKAQEEVATVLRRRRNVSPQEPNNFELHSNESLTRTFNSLSQVITLASFGVCLLSLVVGGIGILNIMLVSVTERTREIGIRKALGATRRRILAQFATEAVALSFLGGLLGVGVGFALAFLARWLFSFPTEVPAWAVALSLGMSCGVGWLFGIYPAARAARLDPVEAMRTE